MAADCNSDDGPSVGQAGGAGRLRRWLPILVIAVVMASAFALGLHKHLSLSSLIMNREALQSLIGEHLVFALLCYCAIYVTAVALSFPGASLITIVSGFLFGWLLAGSVTIVAATLGASIIFLAARTSFGSALRERAGPFLQKLSAGFRENAFSYLLFLRLTPLFPFWVVNLAPALFRVPLRTYVAATALGIIPGTYTFAFLGEGLDSVIAAQEAANPGCATAGTCQIDAGALVTGEILIAFAALGLISLLPVFLKRWRNRRQ